MTQEDKQLLLKDLCARLPYGVIVSIKEVDSDRKPWFGELSCKDLDCFIHDVAYESIKPYLRPMSSMTEEEKKEYKSFFRSGGSLYGKEYEYIDADSDDISQPTSLIDWLNAHHFDFRGLIEIGEYDKGLALEAHEDMYKEK